MIKRRFQIRTRYDEVDQMGYVYHANYVKYCHQARTELLRSIGIEDAALEKQQVMLPVISFDILYKTPAFYDELLTIETTISVMPNVRLEFDFEIFNQQGKLVSSALSTVVFVDKTKRTPMQMPTFVKDLLLPFFKR